MHTDSSFSYFKSCLHIDDERGGVEGGWLCGREEVVVVQGDGEGRVRATDPPHTKYSALQFCINSFHYVAPNIARQSACLLLLLLLGALMNMNEVII